MNFISDWMSKHMYQVLRVWLLLVTSHMSTGQFHMVASGLGIWHCPISFRPSLGCGSIFAGASTILHSWVHHPALPSTALTLLPRSRVQFPAPGLQEAEFCDSLPDSWSQGHTHLSWVTQRTIISVLLCREFADVTEVPNLLTLN